MNSEIFLIDTNSLITPYLRYYPFDFAPGFWNQLEANIEKGSVAVLDIVKSEVLKGNDKLQKWMEEVKIANYIDHRQQEVLEKYSLVLQSIQNNPCYKPSALSEWSRLEVADPWIIAAAAVYGYTIITFEVSVSNLNDRNPCKFAKIPDVAKEFGVCTQDLFYMMRKLNFRLC